MELKPLLMTTWILIASTFASAQQADKGDARIITNSPNLQECDETGTPVIGSVQSIPDGSKFNIYGENGNNYLISLWDWDVADSFKSRAEKGMLTAKDKQPAQFGQETRAQKRMRLNYTEAGKNRYFLVPKANIDDFSDAVYGRFAPMLGTLSYLFKYRPSTGVFENAFNLNITGGVRILFDKTNPNHSLAFTGGVGVTTIPKSVKDEDATSDTTASNVSGGGLTFSGNLVYVWDRLQIGFSAGFDVPVGEGADNWKYRGKPWLSFGIGINIFSENKPSQSTGKN